MERDPRREINQKRERKRVESGRQAKQVTFTIHHTHPHPHPHPGTVLSMAAHTRHATHNTKHTTQHSTWLAIHSKRARADDVIEEERKARNEGGSDSLARPHAHPHSIAYTHTDLSTHTPHATPTLTNEKETDRSR
mmetsp:Transcript_4797/g.11120  ORF Transcript_4797/g.11120 Transcript_4797/m.11120 type:complete len:136 (-) Transcript_4797:139-546(-)